MSLPTLTPPPANSNHRDIDADQTDIAIIVFFAVAFPVAAVTLIVCLFQNGWL